MAFEYTQGSVTKHEGDIKQTLELGFPMTPLMEGTYVQLAERGGGSLRRPPRPPSELALSPCFWPPAVTPAFTLGMSRGHRLGSFFNPDTRP